jgi:tetratricopeptide (TPR) repeat protein
LGEATLALDAYRQSLPLARASGDKNQLAFALNSMAWLLTRLAENQRALTCFERALRYWREIGNRSEESETLNNLGLLYFEKGDSDKSFELFKCVLRPSAASAVRR